MIKLNLTHDSFSSQDGNLDVERLLRERKATVSLSCDEPYYKLGAELQQQTAAFLSSLLPIETTVHWDGKQVGYKSKNQDKRLPHHITEMIMNVEI